MFDFLSMINTYEERVVASFCEGGVYVDTALVTGADKPYETAVVHPRYNAGELVIVELYDTKEEAQAGHDRWVARMTASELPKELVDVSSADIAKLRDMAEGNEGWRTKKLDG